MIGASQAPLTSLSSDQVLAAESANAAAAPSASAATTNAGTGTTAISGNSASAGASTDSGAAAPASTNGVINLSLPLASADATPTAPAATTPAVTPPASTASTTQAAADAAAQAVSSGYHIWIGTLQNEGDARIYWSQEVQRFPDLLKTLSLTLRQIDLGASQGIWFRVLGGPLASREAADKVCRSIKARSPLDDCRVVLN